MQESLSALVQMAIAEDIGSGDITSRAFLPSSLRAHAKIITRGSIVVTGLSTVTEIFRQLDPSVTVSFFSKDGELLRAGEKLLELEGPAWSLLSGERATLNFLGRLIGIATLTHQYVEAVAGTGVIILDTRKMTPGWRILEKNAVKAGGGTNHRQGLFDALLVKDNHLAALGSEQSLRLPEIVKKVRSNDPNIKIEIEADTLEQVEFFLSIKEIDTILLDNMTLEALCRAVKMRDAQAPSIRLEASGGITLANIRAVAETGVDEISLGALTHSSCWADLSMEIFSKA